LDEIGEAKVPIQIKLLRVLQEREFSPVGSHETVRFSGRVIAATNRPLDEMRNAGHFRDDFFYRLCSDVIEMPRLAKRIEEDANELDLLVSSIVGRMLGEANEALASEAAFAIRKGVGARYAWPGNVRELEQAVRRIVLTRSYAGDLRAPRGTSSSALLDATSGDDAERLLARYCHALYERHGTYEEVARRTKLDRRTVKRYVELCGP